ncbi:NUDIX hydrolase [Rothia sp. AR01]|uniref:NUDIX hydrolase n=1 Tax=Rothia santali TaxID=2949643 RepID=A0A9X2HFL3_9MICC|nr:NUDIX hydrolase [Rothia santali]MCP3424846.1 NUDIX hydrolase [Rothia santali]
MALVMDTRPAAYAVIIEQGKILLTHWTGERAPERAAWTLPGGGMEVGETPEQTAVREVYEESGYHVALDGLLCLDSRYADEGRPGRVFHALRILYRAYVTGGALGVTALDDSTDDVAWVPLEELPGLRRVSLVDVAARAYGLPL